MPGHPSVLLCSSELKSFLHLHQADHFLPQFLIDRKGDLIGEFAGKTSPLAMEKEIKAAVAAINTKEDALKMQKRQLRGLTPPPGKKQAKGPVTSK